MQNPQLGYDVASLYTASAKTRALTQRQAPTMSVLTVLSAFFVVLGLALVLNALGVSSVSSDRTVAVVQVE